MEIEIEIELEMEIETEIETATEMKKSPHNLSLPLGKMSVDLFCLFVL